MRHHHHGHRGLHFGRRGGFGGAEFAMAFGFGGRGHGHGERGGRRRMFDGTELRLILLKLIEEQPRHGYDLIKEIEERTGGAYAPSPGVVYPTLTLLADMDLIEETNAGFNKKQFAITDAGTAHLAERAEEVEALFERLTQLAGVRARADGGPVRRAMGNLRAVLQERLAAETVDTDMLHNVAEILDEAARKIERL
jgi:DNA-binding PadR family transcriptional regulator